MKRLTYLAAIGTLVLISLTVLATLPARAADDEEQATGVARISLIRGGVFMTRGDSGDQVATSVNAPLVRGDKIMTGEKSQTEIQLDHSNVIRLAPGSEVRIADLTRKQIQIQVARGLVNYTVLKTNEAEIEIDTPNMAVRPIKEGAYRIQVTSPTETHLIVRKGDADVTTPEGTVRVEDGRMIVVRGSDSPEYQIAKAPGRDDWDKWNKDRDNTIKDAKSYKYANHYYTGAQDLDRHGRWVYDSGYGDWCWTPYVNAGWIPYHDGYWGWQPYWGWTWISYEPWGWAPYHYGRWFHRGSSWYWWPGRHHYGYYPTWGPAYVSFLGFGFGGRNWHFGFGYGYNSIGWLALGPYDHCYSWWGRHNSYNAVNITNITNITNVTNINRGGRGHDQFGRGGFNSNLQTALTNGNVRNGITRVSTDDFVRGNFSRGQRGIDAATLRDGQLVQGRIPASPTRESLRPVDNNSRVSRTSGSDNFFSRRQPPAVNRTFNDQAASVQNMMRNNPFDAASSRRETPGGAAASAGGRAAESTSRNTGSGFGTGSRGVGNTGAADSGATRGRENSGGRFGSNPVRGTETTGTAGRTGASPSAGASAQASGGAQSGWRRFGGSAQTGGSAAGSGRTDTAQRARPSGQAAQPSGQSTQAQDRNWRRFGTGQARVEPGRPTSTGSAPGGQAAPGRTSQERFGDANRNSQGERGSGAAPARIEGGVTAPRQGESTGDAPSGWRRFGSRSENSGSAERPALGIRKPITTERAAPRTFERSLSGGQATGAGSAPSVPRSFEGSGQPAPRSFERGGGTPSGSETVAPSSTPRSFEGSGRAAPSSSPRSFERGGSGGSYNRSGGGGAAPRSFERSGGGSGYGGGSRGWSAPSSGAGRGAPSGGYGGGGNRSYSAPSGGSGGGGSRGYSAPSGGYGGGGGGNRGYSAPSGGGGGHGASAPSGGGRSAPSSGGGRSSSSSSRGGSQQGRR